MGFNQGVRQVTAYIIPGLTSQKTKTLNENLRAHEFISGS